MKNKTRINWWEFKDKEYLYLKKDVLKDLIKRGVSESGSLSKLCIILNTTHFYAKLNDNAGISLKKLKQLLDYLNTDYNYINNKVLEIRRGNKYSIKNPRFPINLENEMIGYILGHVVSDGCLYYDKSRKDLIRTKYSSPDNELIKNFISHIRNIFGDVHFNEEIIRNCKSIRFGNSIIGGSLKVAGAPIGKKYKLNCHIPKMIASSGKVVKRNYLSAVFDDEGSVGENHFPYITMSRNIHISLNSKEKEILKKHIIPLMKTNIFPTGHKCKRISIGKLKVKLGEIKEQRILSKILNHKPKILVDESNLLKNVFNIENSIYVMSLQLTTNLNYIVQSCLVIGKKKSVIKFYKNIGFNLTRKQNKLRAALLKKWKIRYGY